MTIDNIAGVSRDTLSRAIGTLSIVGVESLDGFFGNEIFDIETEEVGHLILKAGISRRHIEREAAVCLYVNELGISAPRVVSLDTSGRILPKPYFTMEKASGSCQYSWEDSRGGSCSVRSQSAEQLAKVHKSSLGKVPSSLAARTEQPWSSWILERFEEQSTKLEREQIMSSSSKERIARLLLDACLSARDGRAKSLLHGDFHPRHVFADNNLRLRQIIDWGDAIVGDPLYDLARLIRVLDRDTFSQFSREYDSQLALDDHWTTLYAYAASWTINAMYDELRSHGDWFRPHQEFLDNLSV